MFCPNKARVCSLRAVEAAMFLCSDLRAPCTYLGISAEDLRTKLISRRLEFKEHDENKQIEQAFTVDKAIFTRDALAKAIYARIFDFLIQVGRRAHPSDNRSPFL